MTSNQTYGSYYARSRTVNKEAIGKSTLQFLVNHDVGNYIHTQQNIAQRSRHGLFTQPMGLSHGDKYVDEAPQPVPKNLLINNRMVQKVGPELFQKMGSTNIGDLYKDKFRQGQLYQKQKVDMSIHNNAFMAGGKQKLIKHSQFQHQKQYNDKNFITRDDNGNVKTGLKNILTGNMKKGFGNTTVGHLFSAYKYQGAPYDNGKEMESKQRIAHKAKIPKPFGGASHPNATFTPDYVAYRNPSQPYQAKNDDDQFRATSKGKWKYNNPNKKGFNGTFTSFPQYIEQGQKPKEPIRNQNIWKPNFNGTSKGFGETLAKPCPAPSQLPLNDIRRSKQ